MEQKELFEYMEKLAGRRELTPEEIQKEVTETRNLVRFTQKTKLAHHLLCLARQTGDTTESLNYVLNLYDKQELEIRRLRKYRYYARESARRLQSAYQALQLKVVGRAFPELRKALAQLRAPVQSLESVGTLTAPTDPLANPQPTQQRY